MKSAKIKIATTVKIVTTVTTKRTKRAKNPKFSNGFVIYEGSSMFDGQPIVVIVTGSRTPSSNPKTGLMLQTWIVRSDIHPMEALKSGDDFSICYNCDYRPDKDGKNRACYVFMPAVNNIWQEYKLGNYGTVPNYSLGLSARIGSYGDPTAVPIEVWENLIKEVPFVTGYSYQWKNPKFQGFKRFCQASCHNEVEYQQAIALGWKAYVVRPIGAPVPMGAVQCPAKPYETTCASCKMCNGNTVSISAEAHGAGKKYV